MTSLVFSHYKMQQTLALRVTTRQCRDVKCDLPAFITEPKPSRQLSVTDYDIQRSIQYTSCVVCRNDGGEHAWIMASFTAWVTYSSSGQNILSNVTALQSDRCLELVLQTLSFLSEYQFCYQQTSLGITKRNTYILKNGVLWDATPCRSCKNRHFEET
jgi:hypothetical protein